ncbi:hypothetical protein ACA910_000945 [Epithemia clementina (nom. ined.)]
MARVAFDDHKVFGSLQKNDMTCVITVPAYLPANIPAELRIVTLTAELKMAPDLMETIFSSSHQVGCIEAVYCP